MLFAAGHTTLGELRPYREVLRLTPGSALYVVDLKRFRQLAAGVCLYLHQHSSIRLTPQDRLRGQYHALSADPNSLANLDQDLPNSMQDTIPIWTLDQDWLWCQTWCSDESLATAKTSESTARGRKRIRLADDRSVDLCQNPLTVSEILSNERDGADAQQKEPKLVRARQIPEWDSYDREIAAFAARLAEHEGGTQALAASVDDLAAEKGSVSAPAVSDTEVTEKPAASERSEEDDPVPHHLEDEL